MRESVLKEKPPYALRIRRFRCLSMMMVVMVMMMVAAVGVVGHMAVLFVAMLAGGFQLQGGMADAVLLQFFPDLFLDLVAVCIGDDVHGGTMGIAINAAYMDMVHILHAIDPAEVGAELLHIQPLGELLQKQIQNLFEIFDGVYQNEQGNADGH